MNPSIRNAIAWLTGRRSERPQARVTATEAQGLLGLVREVVCLCDRDGIVHFASNAAREILGVSPDRLMGESLDLYLHPDDRLPALGLWHRVQATRTAQTKEFRWQPSPYEERSVEWTCSPLPAPSDGRHLAVVIRDVTRQRDNEHALARTRDELTGAIAASPGVLYRLTRADNAVWRLAFVSSNVERLTGSSVSQAAAGFWPDVLMTEADKWKRWRAIEETLDRGVAMVEYGLRTQDGRDLRVMDHLRRADRSDGGMEIVGYLRDVTDERATESKLQLARQEVDTLTTSGPGVLYRAQADGDGNRHILFVSGDVARVTGYSAAEVADPDWFAAHGDPAATRTLADALARLPDIGTATLEFRFRDRAGAWHWVRDVLRVVGQKDGLYQLIGYWTDVTRERELASQLAEAGKLSVLGEMATGMAHELKQTLATMCLTADNAATALRRTPADIGKASQRLEDICNQAHRTAELIDHMRVFGRRDNGASGPVSIAAAIGGAQTIMAGRLRARRVKLQWDLPPDLPDVHGRIILIEQVLINLFANACDAYHASGTKIPIPQRVIELRAETRGTMVALTIADHAGGIPDTILKRIFEPFFTTKPSDQGTGLGLSISHGIVNDLNGRLLVRNDGDGAVFELILPVHNPAETPRANVVRLATKV